MRLISDAVTDVISLAFSLAVTLFNPYSAVTIARRYTITANSIASTIAVCTQSTKTPMTTAMKLKTYYIKLKTS